MAYYINVNGVIGGKSEKPIKNSLDEYFESNLDIELGSILVDGLWIIPPLTFDEELELLNTSNSEKMKELVDEYNLAVARDGATETVKVANARAKIEALDTEYENEFTALLIKYS